MGCGEGTPNRDVLLIMGNFNVSKNDVMKLMLGTVQYYSCISTEGEFPSPLGIASIGITIIDGQ